VPPAPVVTHPRCLDHQAGYHHPESPARLRAILDRLAEVDPALVRSAEPAPLGPIGRVHPERYLDRLAAVAAAGGARLDPDTAMSASSWEAALGAVGAALAATESALGGIPAFAAIRPPGHHALSETPMGFCLLANVVIAAREAQARGVERVLIVDWDVHHGNGTQALVERDPSIRFVSLHQWPHWPGTGAADERGVGNVFNVPMPAGLPPDRYVEGFWSAILEAGQDFDPGLVLISAGFDSMWGDPLGDFTLEPGHYADWVGRLRARFPKAALAAVLEGGYVPARLAEGVAAVVEAMA